MFFLLTLLEIKVAQPTSSQQVNITYTPIACKRAHSLGNRLLAERSLAGLAAISVPIFARLALGYFAPALFSPLLVGVVVLSGTSFYFFNRKVTEAYKKAMVETNCLDAYYLEWIRDPKTATTQEEANKILASRPYLEALIKESKASPELELLNRPITNDPENITLFSTAISPENPKAVLLLLEGGIKPSLVEMQSIQRQFNLHVFQLAVALADLSGLSEKHKALLIVSVKEKETLKSLLDNLFLREDKNISKSAGQGLLAVAKHYHPRLTQDLDKVVKLLVEEFNANPNEVNGDREKASDLIKNEVLKKYLREKEASYDPSRQVSAGLKPGNGTSPLQSRIKYSYPLTLKVATITSIAIALITALGSFIPGSFFTPPMNYLSLMRLQSYMMVAFMTNFAIAQFFIYPRHKSENLVGRFVESDPKVGCSVELGFQILQDRVAAEKLLTLAKQDKSLLDRPLVYKSGEKTTLLNLAKGEVKPHTKGLFVKLLQAGAKVDQSTVFEDSKVKDILTYGDLSTLTEVEKILLLASCKEDIDKGEALSKCFSDDATKALFALLAYEVFVGSKEVLLPLAKFLIDQKANIEARNEWGETMQEVCDRYSHLKDIVTKEKSAD